MHVATLTKILRCAVLLRSDDMKRDMVAVDTIKKAGMSVDQVPEHVTNALTRDYSGLMKAIEKKKGAE